MNNGGAMQVMRHCERENRLLAGAALYFHCERADRRRLGILTHANVTSEATTRPVSLHGRRSTAHRMVLPGEGATRAR